MTITLNNNKKQKLKTLFENLLHGETTVRTISQVLGKITAVSQQLNLVDYTSEILKPLRQMH